VQDYPEPGAAQWVRVDDRGPAGVLDVRFQDHEQARQWGRREIVVMVKN
jgi:hypothetical protein